MHATMPHPTQGRRTKSLVRIGPQHHGKRMPLALFAEADTVPGYFYELSRGVVEVTNIPGFLHNTIVDRIHAAFHLYQAKHPDVVFRVFGSFASKIEMWGRQTERHPDLSVYLRPPTESNDQPWEGWTPEIAIEVVSSSSLKRDYKDKPADYISAGVREYWIIDPQKRSALFLVRRVDVWAQHRVGGRGKWKTGLLPGFTLDLSKVFEKSSNSKRK